MKKLALLFIITGAFCLSGLSQQPTTDNTSTNTFELFSVWRDGKFDRALFGKSCFDVLNFNVNCLKTTQMVHYGDRVGDNWDIFTVHGEGQQSRIVDLGKLNWTDEFTVPVVVPWPRLKPGETRTIHVNASAPDYAHADLKKQVTSEVTTPAKKKKAEPYSPSIEVKKEHMYLMRVVDEENNYYILFRVDDLKRGEKCTVSWKRVESPPETPVVKY